LDKSLVYAKHLKELIWAITYFTKKTPTVSTIESLISIAYGYPFAYEDGIVTELGVDYIVVTGDNEYSYEVDPLLFSLNGEITKFQILVTPVTLKDYISHEADIIALATTEEEPRHIITFEYSTAYSYNEEIVEAIKQLKIPAGLKVK